MKLLTKSNRNDAVAYLHLQVPPQLLRLNEGLFHLHDLALRRLHLGQPHEVLVPLHPKVHALGVPEVRIGELTKEEQERLTGSDLD